MVAAATASLARENARRRRLGPVDLGAVVAGGGGLAHELSAHARARVRTARRAGAAAASILLTSAKRSVTVPDGSRCRASSDPFTRVSLGAERLGVHCRAVFDTLSDKLQATLGGLGRSGRLDEEAISKRCARVRLALLEADVHFEVAQDFSTRVEEKARGQEVAPARLPSR